MTEPIEMLFGMMTQVGHRYHVLDGGPDPQGEGAIFGENVKSKIMWLTLSLQKGPFNCE